jgi:exoribonuclease R
MERVFTGAISLTSKKDGYVRVQELEHDGAIFVDHSHLGTALHQDIVEVELLGKKDNAKGEKELYGKVTRIVERARKGYAGVLEEDHGHYFLVRRIRKCTRIFLYPKKISTVLKSA